MPGATPALFENSKIRAVDVFNMKSSSLNSRGINISEAKALASSSIVSDENFRLFDYRTNCFVKKQVAGFMKERKPKVVVRQVAPTHH